MDQNQHLVSFFLMNKKGLQTLESVIEEFGARIIERVISAPDNNMKKDYFEEIKSLCHKNSIKFNKRTDIYTLNCKYKFAIGWRWIIKDFNNLIVFHDSLLPHYRGFSPLVSALINKEKEIGVTSLFASEGYDEGEIICKKSIQIEATPLKIADAIDQLSILYSTICKEIIHKILNNEIITSYPQEHLKATYSLWRDEEDYRINWNQSAEEIQRFIYAVGYPYKGAFTCMETTKIRIHDVKIWPDVVIENRTPGKIIKLVKGCPVVVCGFGLLEIIDAIDEDTQKSILPLKFLRARFF